MDHLFASRTGEAAASARNATGVLEQLEESVSESSALSRLAGRGTEALRVCLAELNAAVAFATNGEAAAELFEHAIALERDLPYAEPSALPRSPRDTWIELLLRRRQTDDLVRAEKLALARIDL
jgi:hypothetical protein